MEETNGIEVRVGNEGGVSRIALSVLKGFKRHMPVLKVGSIALN